eukprot:gene26146-31572_t
MLVYESFFCELLAPWLELSDLVRLDSGSCTAFHASLSTFLQSKQYGERFGERLSFLSGSIDLFETHQQSNIRFLSMLWICRKKANVTNISLRLDDVKLNVIAKMWKEGLVCHMVTRIDYRVSDSTSWIALAEILSFHFPNVKSVYFDTISMTISNKSSFGSDVLSAVIILAKLWSLNHFSISGGYHPRTEGELELISRILVTAGAGLKSFSISGYQGISMGVIDTLVQHCPAMTAIFPSSHFDSSCVTAEGYFGACRRLAHLNSIRLGQLGSSCGFVVTDSVLLESLPHLPSLEILELAYQPATLSALAAAIKHCPALRKDNALVSLEMEVAEVDEVVSHPSFAQLLRDVDCAWVLSFRELLSSDAKLIARQLSLMEGRKRIQGLILDMDMPLSASFQLLKVLPSLADLELTSVVPNRNFDYEKFVSVLSKYCPKLKRLALRQIQDMVDDDVSALVEELPELETLELNMYMYCCLTEEVFFYLAETKRVWRYISVDNSLACGIYGKILHAIEKLGLKVVTMRIRGDEDIYADEEEHVVIRSWAGTSITGEEFRRRFRKELIEEEQ